MDRGQAFALGDAKGLGQLPGGPVRDADVVDMALAHECIERLELLVERRFGIKAMQLIEIDMVHTQALQAGMAGVDQMDA